MRKSINLYLKALRLERWPRSLAILPGLVAAMVLTNVSLDSFSWWGNLANLVIAFLLTWMISTTNYIVNEITDSRSDAHHPQKRDRPLVEGQVRVFNLVVLGILLTVAASAVALIHFSRYFFFSLTALFLAGILYNVPPIRLKNVPFLDAIVESANNPIRFMIGWTMLSQTVAPLSLLISWWSFGNFLMVGKRVAEKKFLSASASEAYRSSLQKYTPRMLFLFMVGSGTLFLATYVVFSLRHRLFTLLGTIPFIIVYLLIFLRKSFTDREAAEEPEKLLRNPHFALYTLFLVIIFILAFLLK